MGKITRQQSKLHDEALAILSLTRPLVDTEIDFVYLNYSPMANHDVGRGGVFFTPYGLAWEHAVATQPSGRVIDLCSGIGILSYMNMLHQRDDIVEIVAIELNHEFVEVGKKLLPDVVWIEGSVFDLDLISSLGEFDCAISNPPYGKLPTTDAKWLLTKSLAAQYKVMEVALRLSNNGGAFIVPEADSDYGFDWHKDDLGNGEHNAEHLGYRHKSDKGSAALEWFPGLSLYPFPIDTSRYKSEWLGASPDVLIVDLDVNDAEFRKPYGFLDVRKTLFDTTQFVGQKVTMEVNNVGR